MAELKGVTVQTRGLICPDCGVEIVVPAYHYWTPLSHLWLGAALTEDETKPGPIAFIMEAHYKQQHSLP